MLCPSLNQIKALGVVLWVIVWAVVVNAILLAPVVYVIRAVIKT